VACLIYHTAEVQGVEAFAVDSGKVPWPKLREYLFRLSCCPTRLEFMKTAWIEIQGIISYDECAVVMDSEAKIPEGIGKTGSLAAVYNSYYRTKHPAFRDGKHID